MRVCQCCKCSKKASEFQLKFVYSKWRNEYEYRFSRYCLSCLDIKQKAAKIRYYLKNKEKKKEYQRTYNRTSEVYKRNRPAIRRIYSNLRNKRTKLARLRCSTKQDRQAIKQIYADCRAINLSSDVKYVVDHIIPLNSSEVCGLHVAWNLQIITEEANLAKSNSFISDWP